MSELDSIRLILSLLLVLLLFVIPVYQCFAASYEGKVMSIESSPMVMLAYDGKGDFGPNIPNTKTAGWQEALDHCVEHKQDLYIKGGWGGQTAIYHVSDTIHIPATQDFRIDGGVYVINWTGPTDKDMITVDSGMDCHYTLGILVYGGTEAALRIRLGHPVPIDKTVVFIDSGVKASSIADPHPFQRGERKGGTGVLFDTSKGPIMHSDFHFTAVLNFATCIATPEEGGEFPYDDLKCGHLHTNAGKSTLLSLGKKSIQNALKLRIGVDQGPTGVKGIDIRGSYNSLEVNTRVGFPTGNDIILRKSAEGNRIKLIQRRDPFIPSEILTDEALNPTNQLTWTGGAVPIQGIEAQAGMFTYTQRLYPATVRINGGSVSGLSLIRDADSIPLGTSESSVILSPGG